MSNRNEREKRTSTCKARRLAQKKQYRRWPAKVCRLPDQDAGHLCRRQRPKSAQPAPVTTLRPQVGTVLRSCTLSLLHSQITYRVGRVCRCSRRAGKAGESSGRDVCGSECERPLFGVSGQSRSYSIASQTRMGDDETRATITGATQSKHSHWPAVLPVKPCQANRGAPCIWGKVNPIASGL